MAAQNNTGLVVTLSCFVLLTVILGVFMYMTSSHNAQLAQNLEVKTKEASDASAAVRTLTADLDRLKQKSVRVPDEKNTDQLITGMSELIKATAGDGAASDLNLESALVKTGVDRDLQKHSSDDRQRQVIQRTQDLQQTIQRKDAEIKSHQDAALKSEQTLRQNETQHSEELSSLQKQINELRTERDALQAEYSTFRSTKNREIEDLQQSITSRGETIVRLRQRLFEQEDLSFERADGFVTFVDQDRMICYIDLGERDDLQIGTTFSVYTKSNSGVGRRNTEDVKGKIEVVSLLGPHLAEARIVTQDRIRPLSANDPVYSPLFSSGQQLQIAVVGLLDFDGNPGSDSDEFRRIVSNAGARITIRTNDIGDLIDQAGEPLSVDDIKRKVSEKTRFLVVGDTGEESDTTDVTKREIYAKLNNRANAMKEAAQNHGVFVINLSSFLEFIGYTKKRLAWTPTDPFPGKLANGAKSRNVTAGLGDRTSSAVISGAFSSRGKASTSSSGHVSGLFTK